MAKAKKAALAATTAPVRDFIEYGGRREYLRDIPPQSIATLCQRTLNHMLQNEAASKVKNAKDKAEVDGVDFTDDNKATILSDFADKRWSAIMAGTLGEAGARGPMRKGLEAHLHEAALAHIKTKAAAKGKAMPKGDALKDILERAKALDVVKTEAQRRYDAELSAKDETDDVDDLLDGLEEAAE